MTKEELDKIIVSDESFRIERTTSTGKPPKVTVEIVVDVVENVVENKFPQLSDRQIVILKLMAQNPTITTKDLSQKMSQKSRTIQRDIVALKNLGLVEREGGDRGGSWKVNIK